MLSLSENIAAFEKTDESVDKFSMNLCNCLNLYRNKS